MYAKLQMRAGAHLDALVWPRSMGVPSRPQPLPSHPQLPAAGARRCV